jgi:hypothetical protein
VNYKPVMALGMVIALTLWVSGSATLAGHKANAAPQRTDCTRTAKPGVNTVPEAAPAGSMVCLHGGIYRASDSVFRFRTSNVTVKSYPGELAQLRGSIRTINSISNFVLGDKGARWPAGDGLRIDASYGLRKPFTPNNCPRCTDRVHTQGIHWDSDFGGIYANSISNRAANGDTTRAGTGILISGGENPRRVQLDGNFIHRTGQVPRNNHEHAVYAAGMIGGSITDNLIYDAANRGIQMYSHPRGVLVSGNLVAYGRDAGLHSNSAASNILFRNNVAVFNRTWNYSAGPISTGSGNRLTANCFWNPGGSARLRLDSSVTASNNVTAKPRLDSGLGDGVVKVTNLRCAAKLPAGSRFRP